MRKRNRFLCFGLLIVFVVLGCASTTTTTPTEIQEDPLHLHGSYTGRTRDGQTVAFTLTQKESAFTGQGTLKGMKANLSGLMVWRGIANLVGERGNTVLVTIELSPDGKELTLHGPKESIVMHRGLVPMSHSEKPGLLTGYYEVQDDKSTLKSAHILQDGDVLSGTARISGQAAAVAGRLVSDKDVEGTVLFRDRSQRHFKAKISADKKSISIIGLGETVVLKKK